MCGGLHKKPHIRKECSQPKHLIFCDYLIKGKAVRSFLCVTATNFPDNRKAKAKTQLKKAASLEKMHVYRKRHKFAIKLEFLCHVYQFRLHHSQLVLSRCAKLLASWTEDDTALTVEEKVCDQKNLVIWLLVILLTVGFLVLLWDGLVVWK